MAKNKTKPRKIPVIKLEDKDEDKIFSGVESPKPEISKIFQEEGKTTDMTRMERKKPFRRKTLIIAIVILLVVAIASLAGFLILNRENKFSGKKVKLEIETPEAISSGDEVIFNINYLNGESAVLGDVEIALNFPEGFTLKNAEPEPINNLNQAWKIGALKPGKGGIIKIYGVVIGEVDTEKSIKATMSYKPSNFNATFSTEASKTVRITSSIIGLEISGPKRAVTEKELTFKVKYTNDSKDALEKIKITAEYPKNFTFSAANPKASQENNVWQIDRLESNNSGEIEIKGLLKSDVGNNEELKIKVGLIDESGELRPQAEKSILILMVNPELSLNMAVNTSSRDNVANFGDTLTYLLTYKNNSDLEITDLKISAQLKSRVLDWKSLDDLNKGKIEPAQGGSASGGEDKIIWTKEQIEKFNSLKPGDEGEISFKIKIVGSPTIQNSEDKNFDVVSNFTASYSTLSGEEKTALENSSNTITTKINTKSSFSVEGRYYSEQFEQLGSGPLPPEVGQTTSYRIFWYLTNSSNELTNVTIKTTLPADIYWTGKNKEVSNGTLDFNPSTREVIWTMDKVSFGTGTVYPIQSASFEVSATPTADKIGLLLVLTDTSNFSGTDSYTLQNLTAMSDAITSEIPNDIKAQGKGLVIQGASLNSNANTSL
jgi:uncharacterized repeat protein (TIGR01451 family)